MMLTALCKELHLKSERATLMKMVSLVSLICLCAIFLKMNDMHKEN